MTDEAMKQSVTKLLAVVDFDADAAAHVIDAVVCAIQRARHHGGGCPHVRFPITSQSGHRLTLNDPVVIPDPKWTEIQVQRRHRTHNGSGK